MCERVVIFRVRVGSGYHNFGSGPGPSNPEFFRVGSGYQNFGSGSGPGKPEFLDASYHSALKLEKSAISKVKKKINFCHFKNGKKSIFAPEKSLKLPKMLF